MEYSQDRGIRRILLEPVSESVTFYPYAAAAFATGFRVASWTAGFPFPILDLESFHQVSELGCHLCEGMCRLKHVVGALRSALNGRGHA